LAVAAAVAVARFTLTQLGRSFGRLGLDKGGIIEGKK
jgi:hypothetical protein